MVGYISKGTMNAIAPAAASEMRPLAVNARVATARAALSGNAYIVYPSMRSKFAAPLPVLTILRNSR